ncbi:MAG: hypothetical protein AAF531_27090 [Actinomycetota bacterium]
MPKKIGSRPLVGVVAAIALLAAACASEASGPTLDAALAEDSGSAVDESTTSAAADETEAPEAEGPQVDDGADGTGDGAAEEADEPADVGNHLFPDLTTVNVKDGGSLNLATELAGGDTPVLLWFYAPH